MSLTDKQFEALCAGDEGAWRSVIDRHGSLVMLAARRVRLSPAQCEDVFQNTFASAYESIASLRDPDRLASWLYSIAHRFALAVIRRQRPEVPVNLGHAALTRLEDARILRAAMVHLEARCRDLVTALYLEDPGPSYEEISRRFDMPMGSIGPTRARCLRKLRKLMNEVSGGGGRHSTAAKGRSSRARRRGDDPRSARVP